MNNEEVDAMLKSAWVSNKPLEYWQDTLSKLTEFRGKIHKPHARITEVESAISHVQSEIRLLSSNLKWYQKPIGIIVIAVLGGLLLAYLTFRFGW